MEVLFKKPPLSRAIDPQNYQEHEQDWPYLTKSEVKQAIYTSSPRKVARLDKISFLIIQKIYPILEERLFNLYKALFNRGYHPLRQKQAIGIILPKPNRNYMIPKFYRVISLLSYLDKVLEKVLATRLEYFTFKSQKLLYFN